MKHPLNNKGFTITELMIASSIFSVILLLCSFGIIRIGSIYYKGVTATRTQAVARAVSDDLTQAVQYGARNVESSPANPVYGTQYSFSVGNRKYTYKLGQLLVDGTAGAGEANQALQVQSIDDNGVATGPARELLGNRMWLNEFSVQPDPNNSSLFIVRIQVVSGKTSLTQDAQGDVFGSPNFNKDTVRCSSGAGSQFCAVSSLYTKVGRRL